MRRLAVQADNPEDSVLQEGAVVIRGGGLVVVPTDTLYGIAADPFNPAAVDRVFAVKGRAGDQALPLIAAGLDQVRAQIGGLPAAAERLAQAFWPGPLTLVVPAPSTLAAGVAAGNGTVGVRVPAHPVARGLCRAAGTLLTATSANLSGSPPSSRPDEAVRGLAAPVDLLLDAGETPGGPPSTLADVSVLPVRMIRVGAIRWEDIERCLNAR